MKIVILITASCLACVFAGLAFLAVSGHLPSPLDKASVTDEQSGRSADTSTDNSQDPGAGRDPSDNNASPGPEENNANSDTIVPSTGITVYVETGHGIEDSGKWDPGCSWSDGTTDYEEASIMIPIAKAMCDHLKRAGIEVYTDAYDDNNRNLDEVLDFLDTHREVDAFVNLHCDWADSKSGTMPLYRTEEQLALAKAMNLGVHEYIDIPDRGETHRTDLDTLTSDKVHCPAVLFETGSIKADNKILTQEYEDYGKGLAKGLCDYFDIPFPK